jgi:hypothetical protein
MAEHFLTKLKVLSSKPILLKNIKKERKELALVGCLTSYFPHL